MIKPMYQYVHVPYIRTRTAYEPTYMYTVHVYRPTMTIFKQMYVYIYMYSTDEDGYITIKIDGNLRLQYMYSIYKSLFTKRTKYK